MKDKKIAKTITVTKNDVAKGKRMSTNLCPLSHAIARQFKLPVGDIEIFDFDNDDAVLYGCSVPGNGRFLLPKEVCEKVTDYDDGKEMKPFKFRVKYRKA